MANLKQTRQVHKSAVDGRFVSEKFAKKHPSTTFQQTVTVSKPKPKR